MPPNRRVTRSVASKAQAGAASPEAQEEGSLAPDFPVPDIRPTCQSRPEPSMTTTPVTIRSETTGLHYRQAEIDVSASHGRPVPVRNLKWNTLSNGTPLGSRTSHASRKKAKLAPEASSPSYAPTSDMLDQVNARFPYIKEGEETEFEAALASANLHSI